MIDLQTVLTYVTLISVPVGVFYHIMTLNNTRKNQQLQLETRQAQLFMQIYNQWCSRESVKAFARVRYGDYEWTDIENYFEKYGPNVHPDALADQITMNHFFDGLGVLVKKGLIDISIVKNLFSQRIIWFWEQFEDTFYELRKMTIDPTMYEHIEYLYHELKKQEITIP